MPSSTLLELKVSSPCIVGMYARISLGLLLYFCYYCCWCYRHKVSRENSIVDASDIDRLSAGLLRQATYTTARLGVFTILLEQFTRPDGTAPPLHEKAVIGMVAGGIGAVVGTPAEVALIRMTSDGRLPVEQRRNYRNVFDALLRITREVSITLATDSHRFFVAPLPY